MPPNIKYPSKTRSAGIDMGYPAKSKSAGIDEVTRGVSAPASKPAASDGHKPKKGVLTTGGGHG